MYRAGASLITPVDPTPSPSDELSPRARGAIGDAWLEDALAEHVSIASFVRLALELGVLGAPRDLVRRAYLAARDELGHARACFALATHYLGARCIPEPLPPVYPRTNISLAAMARECWTDGCLGEGSAARSALLRARQAAQGPVRHVLTRIAREEAAHAELAWDIFELMSDGRWRQRARGGCCRGSRLYSARGSAREGPEDCWHSELHGIATPCLLDDCYTATRNSALERLGRC